MDGQKNTGRMETAVVDKQHVGTPLHKYVRVQFPFILPSKSQAHAAFKANQILVNGSPARESHRMREGDVVHVHRSIHETRTHRAKATELHLVQEGQAFACVWKGAGVSMDPRSSVFGDAVHARTSIAEALSPWAVVDKPVSGLVLLVTESLRRKMKEDAVQVTHRCLVHGRVGEQENLQAGDEFSIEYPIKGIPCATKVKLISFTRTRNSASGWLSTVDATPVEGFVHKQVLIHLYTLDYPVIGNSWMTKQHRTCRDKGMFLSMTEITFEHPEMGSSVTIRHDEPSKFEALRQKEAKFFERKMEEIELAKSEAFTANIRDQNLIEQEDEGNDEVQDHGIGFQNPAYIRGTQEFRGLVFRVSPSVLIPRVSSAALVDNAIATFLEQERFIDTETCPVDITVLDLGTGSGSLLISAMKQLESNFERTFPFRVLGIGVDISSDALKVARENAELHFLSDRIRLEEGTFQTIVDVFKQTPSPVDMVLCNPPYLSPRIRKVTSIDPSLLNEEPAIALFSGETGYEAYTEICQGIQHVDAVFGHRVFRKGCVLVLEIGHGMGDRARQMLDPLCVPRDSEASSGLHWKFVRLGRDHKKLERCLVFQKA